MATTTNFGWDTPDDTDLVKDGALAIRTLGNSIDTSMVDLKGGTTGQVLSKTSNTDMDFTWVTSDDANAIQNAIVDAKGDLISATAADTPARLAVGNNGETLVADSAVSTGLRWQTGVNRQALVNGGMDVWQRGTSFAVGTGIIYTADRWQAYRQGTVTGMTVSRQTSTLEGFQYVARIQRDSGNTSTNALNFNYQLESADSYAFANRPVTVSFYARCGANYSPTSSNFAAGLRSGTGTDQTIVGGFTGGTNVATTTAVLTTSWQRFTLTGTPASNISQLGVFFYFDPTGTAGANDWVEITGVQLELGSVATTFKRAGNTLAGELACAQRYYWRATAKSLYEPYGIGAIFSTTQAQVVIKNPVDMRIGPTSVEYSTLAMSDAGPSNIAVTALTLSQGGGSNNLVIVTIGSASFGDGNASVLLANNSTSAYIGFNAEL